MLLDKTHCSQHVSSMYKTRSAEISLTYKDLAASRQKAQKGA